MNLDQFIPWAEGQGSLLWAPSPAREYLRGQCVQLVCYYVNMVYHLDVIWDDAAGWYSDGRLSNEYDRIANNPGDPNQVPQRGDIIVWNTSLPGSGGAGHIAICLSATPGALTFISLDQNWGGKTPHQVTHNWSYVLGWLRPRGQAAPAPVPQAPAPAPTPAPQGGDEMIADANQARQAYGLLRLDGNVSQDEINGTAGRRSWVQFAGHAVPEVTARNQHFVDMQTTINNQNSTITDLTGKLTDSTATAAEKQAALTESLQKIASDNADLATLHDKIAEFNANPVVKAQQKAAELSKQPSNFGKFLAGLIASFSKFKFGKKK
jgi:hypothetical protein